MLESSFKTSVVNKLEALLTDNARVVIYDSSIINKLKALLTDDARVII